jgi:hypothetical protein
MRERILYNILLFFLILYAPYWIYLAVIFLGIIIFPLFWESVLFSIFIDFFYGPGTHSGTMFGFPFGIASALLVIALLPFKERFRFHL